MTNLSYIVLSIALPSAVLSGIVVLLFRCGDAIVRRLSFCTTVFVVSCALVYLAQPILWGGALLFSADRLNAPLIRAIGGAAYGLEYKQYVTSSIVYLIAGTTPLVLALVLWRTPTFDLNENQNVNLLERLQVFSAKLKGLVLLLAFILCSLAFFRDGWDKLWYSPLQRFEILERGGFVSYLVANKFLTISLTFWGVLSCVFLYLTPGSKLYLFSAIVCALPFAATLSRAYTIIVVALAAALLWRTRLFLWVRYLLLSVVTGYALLMPLIGRSMDGTGLVVFLKSHQELFSSPKETLSNGLLLGLVQNVSMGQPLVVEALDVSHQGGNITSGVPAMFWILSLSPTMSFIDQYDSRYVEYNPRVNIYTPFNSIALLWAKSPAVLFAFMAVFGLVSCALMRNLARFGALGYAAGIFVLVCLVLAIIRSTQYDLRTMTRYCYAGWAIGIISYIVLSVINSARPRHGRINRRQIRHGNELGHEPKHI